MKKIKILTMLGILILLSISVFATNPPSIVTNSSSNILTESFIINAGVNETSEIKYSYSSLGVEIGRGSFDTNDTSLQLIITNLEGNTAYNWQVNFTSELDKENTVIRNSVTTNQYILLGIVRGIMLLLGTILISIIGIDAFNNETDISKKFAIILYGLIGLILLIAIINGVLIA